MSNHQNSSQNRARTRGAAPTMWSSGQERSAPPSPGGWPTGRTGAPRDSLGERAGPCPDRTGGRRCQRRRPIGDPCRWRCDRLQLRDPPYPSGPTRACTVEWRDRRGETSGARMVTISNLYGYAADSSPMRATDELLSPTCKGAIRTATWNAARAADEAGRIEMTEARASDFIGPGSARTVTSAIGSCLACLRGRASRCSVAPMSNTAGPTWTTSSPTLLAVARTSERSVAAWHVPTGPALTVEQLVAEFAAVADVPPVKVKSIPVALLKVGGVFSPMIRELPETLYQFQRPFVIDATDTIETFGIVPTPLDEQLRATIASNRLRCTRHRARSPRRSVTTTLSCRCRQT